MTLDPYASETGLYRFAGYDGASPTIEVSIGDTITFDQSDSSNWYHPVGFAYEPDGAHGSTWGGAELPEVEGAGELQYYIDGKKPTCADAGDTGLDCYEPEFFFPRSEWSTKKYVAKLTITEAVAAASHGGVIYYFCHIHSKMSGKIVIKGSTGKAGSSEKVLYKPPKISPQDVTCGTSNVGVYTGGQSKQCSERFLCGDLDTDFEKCMQGVDCAMNKEMSGETTLKSSSNEDKIVLFMQQMIPHHQNAVNMAKILLKQAPNHDAIKSAMDEEGLVDILWSIINVQNFQIHQFRNYLKPLNKLKETDIADITTEWRGISRTGFVYILIGSLVAAALAIALGFYLKVVKPTVVVKAVGVDKV